MILEAQIETGTPYLLYKDACNLKSNQQNLGVIKSSNLCSEIVQYSDSKEISCCNLSSIALPKYVKEDGTFDFELLGKVVQLNIRNLNILIDQSYYVVPETETSNIKHRPIGLGVQGLAHLYIKMNIPFESEEARELNLRIFETIYYHSLKESLELAK